MDLTGQILGSYHIFDEIGSGRLGTVYRAYQPLLDRYVAIKVLSPELAADSAILDRVKHQAQVAAKLHHPNILAIHDVGQQDDTCYIVMDYVQDDTLGEVVAREGKIPLPRALPIVEQLAAALDYAHQRGVIHGDVKPANVYVAEDRAALADFGLSQAARGPGSRPATTVGDGLEYVAPEQAQGKDIDHRADLYSLGAVAYEMLTGRRPAVGGTPPGGPQPPAETVQSAPTLRSGLPRPVERVLEKALAGSPDERWASGAALVGALRQAAMARESGLKQQPLALAAQPIHKEAPAEPVAPARTAVRRRPSLFWVAAGLLVILGIVGLGLLAARWAGGAARNTPSPTPFPSRTAAALTPTLALPTSTPGSTTASPVPPSATPTWTAAPSATPSPSPSPTPATATATPTPAAGLADAHPTARHTHRDTAARGGGPAGPAHAHAPDLRSRDRGADDLCLGLLLDTGDRPALYGC